MKRTCDYIAPDGAKCTEGHYGQGLCRAHLWQLHHGGILRPVRRIIPGRVCSECGGPHRARGLCVAHYREWERERKRAAKPAKPAPKAAKPKPAPKPKPKPKPSTMPAGWDRPARPSQMPAVSPPVKAIGPVPPTPAHVLKAASRTVAHMARVLGFNAAELAECCGVDPDTIAEAEEREEAA